MISWFSKISQDFNSDTSSTINYPLAGSVVGGLRVSENIDNMSSISASFMDYEILDGVREIPMSEFGSSKPTDTFYAHNDIERCHALANEIKQSGEIMPLIVAIDNKPGPYILEGGHRFVALGLLGVEFIPALVVIDKDVDTEDQVGIQL